MTNYGNSTTPGSGSFFDTTGNSQYGTKVFVGFPGGLVTDIYIYAWGDGASITVQFCIWDGGDNLVYHSGNQTFGSTANTWQHLSIPGGVYLGSTSALRIGVWTSGSLAWEYESSGAVNFQHSLASGPANFVSGGSDGSGDFGAYITYTPAQVYVNTGTPTAPVWTAAQVVVNTGTPASPTWTPVSALQVNQGTPASPNWVNGA